MRKSPSLEPKKQTKPKKRKKKKSRKNKEDDNELPKQAAVAGKKKPEDAGAKPKARQEHDKKRTIDQICASRMPKRFISGSAISRKTSLPNMLQ